MSEPILAEVLEIPKRRNERGQGSIVQRGKHWQISYYDNQARRRRESYSTRAKAEKALRTKLALKEAGKLDEAELRTSVDVLADLYLADRKGAKPKSIEWLEDVWENHLKPFYGAYQASRITTEKLVQYRNERIEVGYSASTVNKDLTVLKAMFRHGMRHTPPKISRIPNFPVKLREASPRSGFVTDEEYDALQENCRHSWLRALLAVAYTYGFRREELVGRAQRNQPPMHVSQIDLKNRTIRLLPGLTKNDDCSSDTSECPASTL